MWKLWCYNAVHKYLKLQLLCVLRLLFSVKMRKVFPATTTRKVQFSVQWLPWTPNRRKVLAATRCAVASLGGFARLANILRLFASLTPPPSARYRSTPHRPQYRHKRASRPWGHQPRQSDGCTTTAAYCPPTTRPSPPASLNRPPSRDKWAQRRPARAATVSQWSATCATASWADRDRCSWTPWPHRHTRSCPTRLVVSSASPSWSSCGPMTWSASVASPSSTSTTRWRPKWRASRASWWASSLRSTRLTAWRTRPRGGHLRPSYRNWTVARQPSRLQHPSPTRSSERWWHRRCRPPPGPGSPPWRSTSAWAATSQRSTWNTSRRTTPSVRGSGWKAASPVRRTDPRTITVERRQSFHRRPPPPSPPRRLPPPLARF